MPGNYKWHGNAAGRPRPEGLALSRTCAVHQQRRSSEVGLNLLKIAMMLPPSRPQAGGYAGVETPTLPDLLLRDLSRKGLDLFFCGGGGTRMTVSSHAILA
jgi:hypothetical protein